MTVPIAGLIGLALGAGLIWLFVYIRQRQTEDLAANARATADRILEEARKEGEAVRKEAQLQAKDVIIQAKADWEREVREQRHELGAVEKRVAQKEETIDRKLEAAIQREAQLTKREEVIRQQERDVEGHRAEYVHLIDDVREKLEQVAGMTREEAKRTLIDQMLEEARHDAARQIRQIEGEAR